MKKTRGLLLIFSPLLVAFVWGMTTLFFALASTGAMADQADLMLAVKSLLNGILGVASLVSLVLLIVGIVLLAVSNDTKITIKEAIGYGRKKSKEHTKRFLLGFAIVIVLSIINSYFNPDDATVQTTLGMVVGLITSITSMWIMLGLSRVALDIVYEREYIFSNMFVGFQKTLYYVIAYVMTMIITLVGVLLFIVPGIIRGTKLSMVPLLILEKNYNPFKAIKMSRKLTKGFVGDMLAISIISGLINILGVLAVFVGLLWTVPLVIIANAYVYKRMTEINKEVFAGENPAL